MWNDVLHTPSIHSGEAWKGACLRVSRSRYPDQKGHLARSRRAAVVPEVFIENGTKLMVESVLQDVSEGQVERLEICICSIPSTIDVALLAKAITKVKDCLVCGGQPGQLEAIFGAVVEGPDIVIKTLHLRSPNVAQVSPYILGPAAVKLTSLEISGGGGYPTSEQIVEILTRLASTQGSKLRSLNVCYDKINISHISPVTVADALLKLKNLDHHLYRLVLSRDQTSYLLTKIKDTEDLGSTQLDLGQLDISKVASDVVTGAVTNLEMMTIGREITLAQLEAIFTRIKFGGSKLWEITLLSADLSDVSPEALLGALRMLESVTFNGAVLTAVQVSAILTMVNEGSQGKLMELSIVEPEVEEDARDLLEAAEVNDILHIVF